MKEAAIKKPSYSTASVISMNFSFILLYKNYLTPQKPLLLFSAQL